MTTFDVTLVRRIPASGVAPTLTEIGPVKWTDVTVVAEVGGAGTVSVSSTIGAFDSGVKAALLDMAAAPCELWVYRDSVRIHAGPLLGYRIQGDNIDLVGAGLLAYLGYMVRVTDYTASGLDQATIVKALIDTYQATTYGNFGLVTTGLTATGVTRDLDLVGNELPHLEQVITEMGKRANGFDLAANPTTRSVTMTSPRQGTDRTASVIIDGRSIARVSYSQFVSPGQIASDVACTSNSTVGGNLVSTPTANTTLRTSFGRVWMTTSFQDVSVQATLNDHASRFLDDNDSAIHDVAPGLLAVPGFAYTDIAPGDLVTYQHNAGLGLQTFTPRIKTIATTLNEGVEHLALGFF